jgi:hypothetical protein
MIWCGSGSFLELVGGVDGFSPYWGFSLGDAAGGILGSAHPPVQNAAYVLENFISSGAIGQVKTLK